MSIELDHLMVPALDQRAAARLLGTLLGVPWAESGLGPFSPVYVSDHLTLDFIDDTAPLPVNHYCFRVSEAEFDQILARIRQAGIKFRSAVHGGDDMQVSHAFGGRLVYWSEPDGHAWEMLTVSYARPPDA
ncbi:VOC family protein [Vogesella facilis]|uniref:VOC family protein n=1 Tax=Vogesella facilis TaxID=1655232 RepID=A0ABV7RGV9_9NEIS